MSAGPSRPPATRSLSGEEEAQPSNSSANEQTPLLSSQQGKPHRFLGIQVPLWLPRRYIAVMLGFMGMMTVLIVSALFIDPIWRRQQSVFMNNGTHDFRKTVVVISFDGFRADYLHRGLTPNLLATGDSGLRARWLQPSYPSLTFPNHWSIMTGLFPESHGIIANEFIEPETGAHFFYQHPDESWDANWWGGEPMWETAVKAGMKTANLMWPGPPVTRNGNKPTYFVPFRKDNITLEEKSNQILEWIDLPFDDRPQLINMYEPSIDDVGHHNGPDSPEMTEALMNIDVFAHSVRTGLSARNLSSIVDVIFLSDHGMAPTHDRKWIYLDDILGEEGANEIDWKLGQPSAGLWFHPGANVTKHLQKLYKASARAPHNFKVYTATSEVWPNVYNGVEIPQALQNPFPPGKHFSPDHNSRIPPVYVVPELGWSVTWHREKDPWYSNGDHGYDNEHPLMRALFIASGPFTDRVRAQVFAQAQAQPAVTPTPNRFARSSPVPAIYIPDPLNKTSKPPIYVPPRGGGHGPVLIDKFQNVEVYGLVMRLLGIRAHAAQTNGTDGFWDEWFDRL
ncbi:hypothetical protein RSOLAG1IB_05957 [Rhizoctonia solani AG-1 IB]|uniref:Phosphodiest-domain-containing protein n=1 Tax=Thanatephorus cucumeris (strain AG1-IB / isolate 7/3/14) TaxID=1108050 RepID=A0A0B7F7K6_THACB|nr:hypothetical protein RSOLAG1IB_05957 [Rhizoctonia solani AG-1 IB]